MFRNSHLTVLLVASALIVGACGKNSAKKSATPSSALQPTSSTSSPFQGTWLSTCVTTDSLVNFSGSPETHTLVFNGNLLTETVTSYTDTACTQGAVPNAAGPFQSNFTYASITDGSYNYSLSYTDGSWSSVLQTDEAALSGSSLQLQSESNPFTKQ
jgi:hypothetical protein